MLLWATQVPGPACQCQRQHQWHKGRQRQRCRQQQQHRQLQGRRGLGEGRLARLQQAVLGRPRVRGGLRQLAPLPLLLLVPRTLPLQRARMAWERERAARGVSGDEPGGGCSLAVASSVECLPPATGRGVCMGAWECAWEPIGWECARNLWAREEGPAGSHRNHTPGHPNHHATMRSANTLTCPRTRTPAPLPGALPPPTPNLPTPPTPRSPPGRPEGAQAPHACLVRPDPVGVAAAAAAPAGLHAR